ncbi:MAG TPA: type II toxin-antitoxin system RelE/ParE family toxin, partial [Burkholderiaceae bacterium]|nr:type II toxin-antitoxin system RelE/ParE family toxin [Burkholderiaceae bacterium]
EAVQASAVYGALLDELVDEVIPNLRRFPRMGRRYTEDPPRSVEALSGLGRLPLRAASELRQLLHGDFLILYLAAESDRRVHLLSIRHHRELSFQGIPG